MYKCITLICITLMSYGAGCRDVVKTKSIDCKFNYDSLLKEDVYYELSTPPEYPKGYSGLLKFLLNNLQLKNYEKDIGRVDMKFIIGKNGNVMKIYFLNNLPSSMKIKIEELFRNERFSIGSCDGRKVVSTIDYHVVW